MGQKGVILTRASSFPPGDQPTFEACEPANRTFPQTMRVICPHALRRDMDGAATSAAYDRSMGVGYDAKWYNAGYFAEHQNRRDWYYPTAVTLANRLKPRAALDIGCGIGMMVEAWTMCGIDAHGVDVAPAAIGMGRPEIAGRLRVNDVTKERLPYADGSFDLVTSIEVVEHLPDHENYLKEVFRVLRPGGYAFIQTPKPNTPEALGDATHISVKAKAEWKRLFTEAGFVVRDNELLPWEHELPMTTTGRKLGWLRYTMPLKQYVVKTGTRTLYRKPLR